MEFALAAPVFLILLFGCVEYGRMLWTWHALQLAGDETARCVAIGSSTCASAATYAVTDATNRGAFGLTTSNVKIDNAPPTTTNAAACSPPTGNTAVRVQLTLKFTSTAATLLPALTQTLVTTSCFPVSGN